MRPLAGREKRREAEGVRREKEKSVYCLLPLASRLCQRLASEIFLSGLRPGLLNNSGSMLNQKSKNVELWL
jgi:hypothetical protein